MSSTFVAPNELIGAVYKQSIAVIAPDGANTNFVSNNPQPIALNPTQYNIAGNIALNDLGVIKVGTAANTQGSSFICSVVQEVTSNFHSFDDTSTWAPTTAGLGAASFNAGITTTGATNINHVNGFQTTFNINGSGTTSTIRGINPVLNVANGTVTAFNGIEVTDPIITSGGVVTGTYAFAYNGSGTAGYNWGVYQSSAAGSTAHGPWNYMNAPLGLGVQVPNGPTATCALMIAPGRTIGWGTGNGAAQVYIISQANGIVSHSGPIQGAVYTIAQLLALTNLVDGELAYVADTVGSGAASWHGAIAGGGSTTVAGYAFYNLGATAWQWA